jgi:hypothetical protein
MDFRGHDTPPLWILTHGYVLTLFSLILSNSHPIRRWTSHLPLQNQLIPSPANSLMTQNMLSDHKHPHLTSFHLALGWPRSHLEKPFEHLDLQPERVALRYSLHASLLACKAQTRTLQDVLSTQGPCHPHHLHSFINHPVRKVMVAMYSASCLRLTRLYKPGFPFLQSTANLIHNNFSVAVCNHDHITSFIR